MRLLSTRDFMISKNMKLRQITTNPFWIWGQPKFTIGHQYCALLWPTWKQDAKASTNRPVTIRMNFIATLVQVVLSLFLAKVVSELGIHSLLPRFSFVLNFGPAVCIRLIRGGSVTATTRGRPGFPWRDKGSTELYNIYVTREIWLIYRLSKNSTRSLFMWCRCFSLQ